MPSSSFYLTTSVLDRLILLASSLELIRGNAKIRLRKGTEDFE